MAFLPGHDVECCTGNVNRFMPYYIEQMWLHTKDNGIAAALFGPGEIEANVGASKQTVKITESTKYPFEEKIDFTIGTKKAVKFPFQIRIPGWCKNPSIAVNGKKINAGLVVGQFYTINRAFANGDKITLSIPMSVKITSWPNDGMAVERGHIVYRYPIPQKKYTLTNYKKSTPQFPGVEYRPVGAWNYSLKVANANDVQVIKNDKYTYPWSAKVAPVTLKVPAEKLENWKLRQTTGSKGEPVLQTSAFPANRDSTGKKEYIDLVPYGSTFLRVTVFPEK
jgi:hypothetical protein